VSSGQPAGLLSKVEALGIDHMKIFISFALLALLFVVPAMPVSANHDQGQGKSQDHLHRGGRDWDGSNSQEVVTVPEPFSAIVLGLGVTIFAGGAALGAFGRRKSTSGQTQPTDEP
jgi:hypothetical protein